MDSRWVVGLTSGTALRVPGTVQTPEKWDVVTRKSGTDETSLGAQCGLLIIDEVHLLADERGAVIESVVARVHRFVEARQRQVRIVALSATLPNYDDVAAFLQVPDRGVFYFGPEHRPVPLQQQFIGINVKSRDRANKERKLDEVCFDTVLHSLQRGYQVMVFVHSRKGTGDTARALATLATGEGVLERHFVTQGKDGPVGAAHKRYADRVKKSQNRELQAHFEHGIGIHHAGMLRGDRKLAESMFADGAIRVLCCTATLAWGVNLPAHTIVIKGTEVYNPEKGGTTDLSILDVQQIFGRAGRPQFDTSGEATMITTLDAFPRYMDKLVRAIPVESNFTKQLADHLNAEIAGGSVANIREAATWLTYTYLYIRMLRNPLAYAISADKKFDDPSLRSYCLELVSTAAKALDREKMIRYHVESGNLAATETGRIAANFYVQAESVATFQVMFGRRIQTDSGLVRMVASASEFSQMKLRQEEIKELEGFVRDDEITPLKIRGAGMDEAGHALITDAIDKTFVLIQVYTSRANIKSFTLVSDVNYIASNASRVSRALFEMCLSTKQPGPALKLLRIAKSLDNRIWWFQTPLRHFDKELKPHVLSSLERNMFHADRYDAYASALSLLDMQKNEVGQLCRSAKDGAKVQGFVRMLPKLEVSYRLLPITSDVVRMHVTLTPSFDWHGRWHGGAQSFWFWIETESEIHHHEHLTFTKRSSSEPMVLEFSIPTFHKASTKFVLRVVSDSWVGVEESLPFTYEDSNKASRRPDVFTALQDLTPLPTSALNDPRYEKLYKFEAFNPVR
jgi:activating signal cointegrator complex subunit 3